ncbi:metallophosphoesterase [Rhizobium leguminosarum]|uniref:metallophosphoesterase n=1 Tax=Rhizobium leguminosarum TaxID=384 RepID=UPI002FEF523D
MKLWIVSDLHIEFGMPFTATAPTDADVLVCAGDIRTKGIVPSIEWLATNIGHTLPIILVAGNHEFYGASVQESIRDAREAAGRYPNIHFLENSGVDIGGVTFVGATLWTDFRLFGRDPALAMETARNGMNDFKRIKLSKLPYQKFRPIHAFRRHQESKDFIASALRDNSGRKTIVISHHAPSTRSIPREFRDDPLSGCYASDLEGLIQETQPELWVHGHVHNRNDYLIGKTRVVSNPRGYPDESTGFDPALLAEVAS